MDVLSMWKLLMAEEETAVVTCPVRPINLLESVLACSQGLECEYEHLCPVEVLPSLHGRGGRGRRGGLERGGGGGRGEGEGEGLRGGQWRWGYRSCKRTRFKAGQLADTFS